MVRIFSLATCTCNPRATLFNFLSPICIHAEQRLSKWLCCVCCVWPCCPTYTPCCCCFNAYAKSLPKRVENINNKINSTSSELNIARATYERKKREKELELGLANLRAEKRKLQLLHDGNDREYQVVSSILSLLPDVERRSSLLLHFCIRVCVSSFTVVSTHEIPRFCRVAVVCSFPLSKLCVARTRTALNAKSREPILERPATNILPTSTPP